MTKYLPETKQTIRLGELVNPDVSLIDEINGKLYYMDGIGLGIFREDTLEKEEFYHGYAANVAHDEAYLYFIDENDFLYRTPIGEAQAEQLTDVPVRYYYLTEEYLYYKMDEKVVVGTFEDGTEADMESPYIYRMKKDGTEKECVWTFQDDFRFTNCTFFAVYGDYIYSRFFYWDEEEQGFWDNRNPLSEEKENCILRIDITNQEIQFLPLAP